MDFYCAAARLVVEVDGPIHDWQTAYDAERDRILVGYELHILRVRNDEVLNDLPNVLARIRDAARAALASTTKPEPSNTCAPPNQPPTETHPR